MSTLGAGNGDSWPPEGGGQSGGLPGLPPEWGNIVIPDDLAELATEAAAVRRELRRDARRTRWRRRLGLPARPEGDDTQPSLGLPLLIMSIAVVATLTSLFAVAWPGRNSHPILNPQASRDSATSATLSGTIPDLTLTDATGAPVRLRDTAPAALLLVDGCRCAELVAATVSAAPRVVTVLLIGRTVPTLQPSGVASAGAVVRRIADPGDKLRSALGLVTSGGRAAVVLVARGGTILRALPGVGSVDNYRADLAKLT